MKKIQRLFSVLILRNIPSLFESSCHRRNLIIILVQKRVIIIWEKIIVNAKHISLYTNTINKGCN